MQGLTADLLAARCGVRVPSSFANRLGVQPLVGQQSVGRHMLGGSFYFSVSRGLVQLGGFGDDVEGDDDAGDDDDDDGDDGEGEGGAVERAGGQAERDMRVGG